MVMCLEKIKGAKNPANMMTKCVDVEILMLCKASIGSAVKMIMIV